MNTETKSKEEAQEAVRKFYADYFQSKIIEFEEGLKESKFEQLVVTPIEIPGLCGRLDYGLDYRTSAPYQNNPVPGNYPTIQGCYSLKAKDFELEKGMRKYRMLLIGARPPLWNFKQISYTSDYNERENPRIPYEATAGKVFGIIKNSHDFWERRGEWVFTAPLDKLKVKVKQGFPYTHRGSWYIGIDFNDEHLYSSGFCWTISQRKFNQLIKNSSLIRAKNEP